MLKVFKFCLIEKKKKIVNKYGKIKDLFLCLDSSFWFYIFERLSIVLNSFLLSW